MNPRVLCAALLYVAATALAKPQNFNSLSDANHFVVQAQPVSEGGSSAAGVPVFNGIPLTGPAALLAGDKKSATAAQLKTPPTAPRSTPIPPLAMDYKACRRSHSQ
ncbi:hypothetical protein E2C01_017953 [Portunus trituberculatus]|uniref:Uncharacterized protein n=1 Tax=Portunus trituberculatus TaxID=210409 RepID=A0A5B7DUX9_PORTR|nr:hypothetical protein [Portunus trituberculatus]